MIYFIKHSEFVKIGYTTGINNRLSQLQTSSPHKLQVVGLIDGDLNKEKELHQKFIHLSTSGEWFNYTKELEDYIDKLDKSLLWKYGFIVNGISVIGLIKSCRLENNLSLQELGDRLGITKQSVMDMEKRELHGKISIDSMRKALNTMGYKLEFRALKIS
jgi:DNA-binding XRE family transcriptional regulator